ncbi:metallophosphoesterase family protein [Streptacidiphilus rugosus]|uniref:metallophosphoesterase family protein n=1 Tax=Streptacidiphilus rugosus TaxID=405783 RepID=UPI00056AD494|nr:metallophosphoesterase [Streptacidiphilus rugosus]
MQDFQPESGRLLAISDTHVRFPENRDHLASVRPTSPDDWLLLAGDVGERLSEIEWALTLLAKRFARVVWTPGNHELRIPPGDPTDLRGEQRYRHLVALCRSLGILTPEDPYAIWRGQGGPATIVPVFLLYDYSLRPEGMSKQESLAGAFASGRVSPDEARLFSDPYFSTEAWCHARLRYTEQRLRQELPGRPPAIFVTHYPLDFPPPGFAVDPFYAQWCGTTATRDWHRRFPVETVVYGHLHSPGTHWDDGVRFEEVSVGRPEEWQPRDGAPAPPRCILPGPAPVGTGSTSSHLSHA